MDVSTGSFSDLSCSRLDCSAFSRSLVLKEKRLNLHIAGLVLRDRTGLVMLRGYFLSFRCVLDLSFFLLFGNRDVEKRESNWEKRAVHVNVEMMSCYGRTMPLCQTGIRFFDRKSGDVGLCSCKRVVRDLTRLTTKTKARYRERVTVPRYREAAS